MNATRPPAPNDAADKDRIAEVALQEAGDPCLSLRPTDRPADRPTDSDYVLTLYVASLTPRSVMAIQSVKDVCEKHLTGQYALEIVDIYERPSLAKHDQILAAPTLIKRLPLPLRRLIGDMADEHRVLVGLDLRARTEAPDPRG
ncbi:MAG: circadian clock KaiB family protein [Lamprobacter sp.]|uniref:circadian clock KaiB family protein n=1 Tax=Lamprobacter sp. TaxID=3100796 RepID=UPI002B25BBCC|nr:circadian clock KaiB family protein [Lamprobacter sp.]MEA3641455.1 circadian clock KaiB family protein [Lamprobacter sp.]